MDIRNQLPYLGETQKDGYIKIGKHFTLFALPFDYQRFKSTAFNSEEECASALIGIELPNFVYKIIDDYNEDVRNDPTNDTAYETIQYITLFLDIKGLCCDGRSSGELRCISNSNSLNAENNLPKIKNITPSSKGALALPLDPIPQRGLFHQIGIKYDTLSFLNWAKKNSFPIPKELAFQEKNGVLSWLNDKQKPDSKLRADQEDKMKCQEIAQRFWGKYPILDIKHMKQLPDIKRIGKIYKDRTVHNWLSEVSPGRANDKGQRPLAVREEQEAVCRKLNIFI